MVPLPLGVVAASGAVWFLIAKCWPKLVPPYNHAPSPFPHTHTLGYVEEKRVNACNALINLIKLVEHNENIKHKNI